MLAEPQIALADLDDAIPQALAADGCVRIDVLEILLDEAELTLGPPRLDKTACSHAPSRSEHELVKLVAAVRRGDNAAWTQLIERFDRMLYGIARSYRLSAADIDDVVQATWLRLHQHIGTLREPAAIAGWLATTTRRESLRVLQAHTRGLLTADPELGESIEQDRLESELLTSVERGVLGRALAALPDRQRQLMLLLATDPDAYYHCPLSRLPHHF